MKPVRVLHVLGQLNLGGAESRIMDLYRAMDKERVQFDFVVHTKNKCYFDDEIEKMGGHIYNVPRFRVLNYFEYVKAWKKLLSEHKEWTVIEGHMTSTAAIYLPIAKRSGIKTTAAHARSAGTDPGFKGWLTRFLRRNLANKADVLLSCSEAASISVYGSAAVKKGLPVFLPNAINCGSFTFDPKVREAVRKELQIGDSLCLGHVGRFHYAKNHEYLLMAYAEFLKLYEKDSVLLLIGDGALKEESERKAAELGISDKVKFLGNRSEIYKYYMAMDLFVYPSRYEGMPGTVVEAQASGLKVLMSSEICDEVIATPLVKTLDITQEPALWAKEILKATEDITPLSERSLYAKKMEQSGFDAIGQSHMLVSFYETGEWIGDK